MGEIQERGLVAWPCPPIRKRLGEALQIDSRCLGKQRSPTSIFAKITTSQRNSFVWKYLTITSLESNICRGAKSQLTLPQSLKTTTPPGGVGIFKGQPATGNQCHRSHPCAVLNRERLTRPIRLRCVRPKEECYEPIRKQPGHRRSRCAVSYADRKPAGPDDEAGLLLYAPPIRQSADSGQGVLRAAAGCVRHVRWEDRPARQEAGTAAGDERRPEYVCPRASVLFGTRNLRDRLAGSQRALLQHDQHRPEHPLGHAVRSEQESGEFRSGRRA